METNYKDYMRYGEILSCEDFDFTSVGGNIITVKVAKLGNNIHQFICVNGQVTADKRLNEYIFKGK